MNINEQTVDLNNEEQYSAFENTVIKAAKKQADVIIDQAKTECDDILREAQKEMSNDDLDKRKQAIAVEMRRRFAAAEQDSRRKLLVYRKQLVNALFAEVEDGILAYTNTPEYDKRITDLCKSYAEKAGHNQVGLVVRKADEKLAENWKNCFKDCNVAFDKSIRLGGVRIVFNSLLYDETLDYDEKEERTAFLQYCGLHVDPLVQADETQAEG